MPVKEAINTLPIDEQADVLARLKGIEEYGFDYSRVQFKQVKGKLWEIKYKYRNQHRILYCMKSSELIVLLHYVKKKTQKLETNDLDISEKRMMEVLNECAKQS
ncbi:type II toxin-antitoxin system RelE/ParE family toxin [Facilibium subflavum]|uniref:type II toxin-antitoxin system RelE/ParE family toxin n=1 Tax=Facilibium subflavum TaxID=2219058 RepID=UPI001AAD46C3|nr:type II toxin-antitoxin system RelE/ParE family toxin [Facilibium subflavum]